MVDGCFPKSLTCGKTPRAYMPPLLRAICHSSLALYQIGFDPTAHYSSKRIRISKLKTGIDIYGGQTIGSQSRATSRHLKPLISPTNMRHWLATQK